MNFLTPTRMVTETGHVFRAPADTLDTCRRISFLSTAMSHGGAEKQVAALAAGFARRGLLVQVIAMVAPDAHVKQLRDAGVDLRSLDMTPGRLDPRALPKTIKMLREFRPDVLTCFMFHANLLGRISAKIARVPAVVCSIRSENFGGAKRDLILRLTDRMADVTVTNSEITATKLLARRVVAPHRMRVIPNAIDLSRYDHHSAHRILNKNTFEWLALGRLTEAKDYPTLLSAFAMLPTHARLSIGGDGTIRAELERLAAQLKIEERVKFLGHRDDVPELLAACDAFVLSSAWEGLPNVIMEAMAAGKPVVATDVGGVRELVREQHTGFVVSPRSASALAAAMEQMMRLSEAQRTSFGAAGRVHMLENFSEAGILDRWLTLFNELLAKKHSTR